MMEQTEQSEGKPFYKSKRFWTTIITAALPYIPYVGPWALAHPEALTGVLALVFGWVGVKTTEPVQFKEPVKRLIKL